MKNPLELSALVDAIWQANLKNVQDIAKQSYAAYLLPPIFANLEIISDRAFSKLLADTQKRAFYLGAMAMAATLEDSARAVKQ